jgi:nicotinamide-nucleotide amidase
MNSVDEALDLAQVMMARKVRVVFAESCTAGLVSAMVSMTPGISEFLCGSAVTYREQTKAAWLDVSPDDLATHSAVSEQVTRQMALGVLEKTLEADWAAAITGHLGPNAPAGLSGIVYIVLAKRTANGLVADPATRHTLKRFDRVDRQEEATALLMQTLREALEFKL